MTKLTLSDLASLENQNSAITLINNNNDAIEAALENTLSRDGTTPNSMATNLDMNSNRILNLPAPTVSGEPVRLGDVLGSYMASFDAIYTSSLNLRIITDVTTTRTLSASDSGTLIRFTNSSPITVTSPNNLAAGFNCFLLQVGAGAVTVVEGSGATIETENPATDLTTAAQWRSIALAVHNNSGGSAAEYLVVGGAQLSVVLASGKTFAINNTLTLAGTDSATITFQGSDTYVGRSTTDTLTNKTLNASNNTVSNLATSMFAANVVDTDATLAANSDTRLSSQKAIKTYLSTLTRGATLNISTSSSYGTVTSVNPTEVMGGFGSTFTITPTFSGRIRFTIKGSASNTTGGDATRVRLRYGTGTAPTQGAALTGTVLTPLQIVYDDSGANGWSTFAISAIATGLTLGTAYWFDLGACVDGGSGDLDFVHADAFEF